MVFVFTQAQQTPQKAQFVQHYNVVSSILTQVHSPTQV